MKEEYTPIVTVSETFPNGIKIYKIIGNDYDKDIIASDFAMFVNAQAILHFSDRIEIVVH